MSAREKLVRFIETLTDEETERVIDFLKNAEKLPDSGKESK